MCRAASLREDATPQLYRIVYFTADANGRMSRKETIAVAVTPHKDRSSGGGRLSTRLFLKRGMCRASWLQRTFPQLSSQRDCLLLSMVPYVDGMFGVEA